LLLFATIVFELLRSYLTYLHYSSFLPCRSHFAPLCFWTTRLVVLLAPTLPVSLQNLILFS